MIQLVGAELELSKIIFKIEIYIDKIDKNYQQSKNKKYMPEILALLIFGKCFKKQKLHLLVDK